LLYKHVYVMIALVGIGAALASYFYSMFKKTQKDNKRHIALCVCAIIFGGVFNLIAGIVMLCDNNRK